MIDHDRARELQAAADRRRDMWMERACAYHHVLFTIDERWQP